MPSFDIQSKVDGQTLDNAVNVVKKEILNRWDFKGTHVSIELDKKEMKIEVEVETDMKLEQAIDVLLTKAMRQGLEATCFDLSKDFSASGKYIRKTIPVKNGLSKEDAKRIVKLIKDKGLSTSVGDEGGFAPRLQSNEHAIELLLNAIEKSNYKAGKDVFLALDVAASSFYSSGQYSLKIDNKVLDADGMIKFYDNLITQYPIISIEDGLDENDWNGWAEMNTALGKKIQVVGDDLTVTSPRKLEKAIRDNAINSILIKLNQIGTVSETIQAIDIAKQNNCEFIISHRSGETEDTFIADLAVAMGGGQIKTGSASRSERIAKYNRLLEIEAELGKSAIFGS